MRCLIIEDEPLAQERLKQYISKLPHLELEGCFDNAVDALLYLRENNPDILFLDINLGEMSGIQLLEVLKPNCAVIITTAYQEFALKGYELNVTDYLMKPFTFDRFYQSVEKVQTKSKSEPAEKSFVFIKTEYRLEKVLLDDIIYIEGMRDYRMLHLENKKNIMTLQTFVELEKMFPPQQVCRIHKSFMVAVGRISSVEKDRVYIAGKHLPVSDTYKKTFFDIIGAK